MTSVEEEERWKQCRMAGEETSSIYQGGYHENRLIGFGGWLNGIVSSDADCHASPSFRRNLDNNRSISLF